MQLRDVDQETLVARNQMAHHAFSDSRGPSLYYHHDHTGGERGRIIQDVAIRLEAISVIPGQSVSGADPDIAPAVADNTGEYVVRRESLGGGQAVEVEDGEELVLGS